MRCPRANSRARSKTGARAPRYAAISGLRMQRMSRLIYGALIAVVTGIAYNASAALQKHEAIQVETGARNLLGKLLKRKAWVAATALSSIAWVGQVAALSLAPVALVVPLLSIG